MEQERNYGYKFHDESYHNHNGVGGCFLRVHGSNASADFWLANVDESCFRVRGTVAGAQIMLTYVDHCFLRLHSMIRWGVFRWAVNY